MGSETDSISVKIVILASCRSHSFGRFVGVRVGVVCRSHSFGRFVGVRVGVALVGATVLGGLWALEWAWQ